MIKLIYRAVDGASEARVYRTVAGARKRAQYWVGETPDISYAYQYAVSADGVGTITVQGAATLRDLFPKVAIG